MNDGTLILIIEIGAVLWVATWVAEVAYNHFRSTRSERTAYWLEQEPMECPACKEISLSAIGVVRPRNPKHRSFVEYECEECHHYETS